MQYHLVMTSFIIKYVRLYPLSIFMQMLCLFQFEFPYISQFLYLSCTILYSVASVIFKYVGHSIIINLVPDNKGVITLARWHETEHADVTITRVGCLSNYLCQNIVKWKILMINSHVVVETFNLHHTYGHFLGILR